MDEIAPELLMYVIQKVKEYRPNFYKVKMRRELGRPGTRN